MFRKINGPPDHNEKRSANVPTSAERNVENQCSAISTHLVEKIKRLDAEISPTGIAEIAFADGRWDSRKSNARCFLAGNILINSANDRWVNLSSGRSGTGTTSLIAEAFGSDLETAAATVEALLLTLTDDDGETDWPCFLNEAA